MRSASCITEVRCICCDRTVKLYLVGIKWLWSAKCMPYMRKDTWCQKWWNAQHWTHKQPGRRSQLSENECPATLTEWIEDATTAKNWRKPCSKLEAFQMLMGQLFDSHQIRSIRGKITNHHIFIHDWRRRYGNVWRIQFHRKHRSLHTEHSNQEVRGSLPRRNKWDLRKIRFSRQWDHSSVRCNTSQHCESSCRRAIFAPLHDSLLRDCLVLGVNDDAVTKKLLQDRGLTLQRAIDICWSGETTNKQLKELKKSLAVEESPCGIKEEKPAWRQPHQREERPRVQILWWNTRGTERCMPSLWTDMQEM